MDQTAAEYLFAAPHLFFGILGDRLSLLATSVTFMFRLPAPVSFCQASLNPMNDRVAQVEMITDSRPLPMVNGDSKMDPLESAKVPLGACSVRSAKEGEPHHTRNESATGFRLWPIVILNPVRLA